jgi:hypothetical protein
MWMTCKKFGFTFLLNTTSFWQFQIPQTKAQTPTRIRAFVPLSTPLSQFPNKLLTLEGGGMLKVKCTTRQTRHANEHDINKWSIVSRSP